MLRLQAINISISMCLEPKIDCTSPTFTLLRQFSGENVYQNRENVYQNCVGANKS